MPDDSKPQIAVLMATTGSLRCSGFIAHKFEHLACFIPAMLALGVKEGAVTGDKAERYLSLAKDLTYTCWQMYDRHATGLLL